MGKRGASEQFPQYLAECLYCTRMVSIELPLAQRQLLYDALRLQPIDVPQSQNVIIAALLGKKRRACFRAKPLDGFGDPLPENLELRCTPDIRHQHPDQRLIPQKFVVVKMRQAVTYLVFKGFRSN